ncbi:MAG: hypothetical protein MI810_04795 [Flavobacteriales bacterium]|nr:hypothetical protein [Flavobacteriales bacterium]
MKKAKKSDWEIKEMPSKRAEFELNKSISKKEYEQLSLGLIPQDMDDRWFIYALGKKLFFHRSWVGSCIYIASIEKKQNEIKLTKAIVNRDKRQYWFENDEWDKKLINYLIDSLLLGKEVAFPRRGYSV